MVRLFVASVILSAMQDAKSVYEAIMSGFARPNNDTVHAVVYQLVPALELGAIGGAITGFTVITIWSLGNPLWAILSPFLGNATALLGNIAGSYSRSRGNKKDGGTNTS
jgi:hypothetical protein